MDKLQSFLIYAFFTPVVAFNSSSVLAEENTDSDANHNSGFYDSVPSNGMHASDLIGAIVRTGNNEEEVGSISELVIDESGQVVAVVVGVGGFLGIGEKDVAIGWDDVTRSNADDDQDFYIMLNRDELTSAPTFERRTP